MTVASVLSLTVLNAIRCGLRVVQRDKFHRSRPDHYGTKRVYWGVRVLFSTSRIQESLSVFTEVSSNNDVMYTVEGVSSLCPANGILRTKADHTSQLPRIV